MFGVNSVGYFGSLFLYISFVLSLFASGFVGYCLFGLDLIVGVDFV